jgi:hypothetical protein
VAVSLGGELRIPKALHPGMMRLPCFFGPQVLDEHWDTAEGSVGKIWRSGSLKGPFELPVDDGIELVVQAFNAVDSRLHGLERGKITTSDQCCQTHRVKVD